MNKHCLINHVFKTTNKQEGKISGKVKKLILFISLAFFGITIQAQEPDRWEIKFNKQIIFKGSSNQTNPTAFLKTSALKKTDKITIRYLMDNPDKDWKRTFLIRDESENNIATLDLNNPTGAVTFNVYNLQALRNKKKPFFIYTVSLPKDPSLAAAIRVKRILLCKIEWNKL
jgi:hypothetical protein